MEFVVPLIYKFFINDVILSANLSKLYIVIAGYLITYLVGALSGYIKIWSQNTVVNTILYRVRQKILKNYMDFPFSEYETACVGDMKMRIDDDTNQINELSKIIIQKILKILLLIIGNKFLKILSNGKKF